VPGDDVAERLLAHVRGRLAGYKVPRRVEFVEELPRTATGKLVKGRLRNRFAPTTRSQVAHTEQSTHDQESGSSAFSAAPTAECVRLVNEATTVSRWSP
jgi:hypothetical protein